MVLKSVHQFKISLNLVYTGLKLGSTTYHNGDNIAI